MTRDFKGVWIPKEIWLDTNLTWMQRLLLVEIDSLDSADHCFASNAHFAQHLQLSKSRISDLVSSLEQDGYIQCSLNYQGKQVIKRTITITNKVVSIPNTPHRDSEYPPSENGEGINTKNINTNNKGTFAAPTIDEVEAFKIKVGAHSSPQKFCDYYEARGWLVGQSIMESWKAAYRNWEAKHHEFIKDRESRNVQRAANDTTAGGKWLDINAKF
jgi:hypothetical protein